MQQVAVAVDRCATIGTASSRRSSASTGRSHRHNRQRTSRFEATATAAPEPTATAAQQAQVVATALVNLRSGPGTTYDLAGGLQAGESATILAKIRMPVGGRFHSSGTQGWVFGELVQTSGALDPIAVAANIPPHRGTGSLPRQPSQPPNPRLLRLKNLPPHHRCHSRRRRTLFQRSATPNVYRRLKMAIAAVVCCASMLPTPMARL